MDTRAPFVQNWDMLTIFATLLLSLPFAPEAPSALEGYCLGQIVCPFTPDGDRGPCVCTNTIIRLGEWDPRPSPEDWHQDPYIGVPTEWGTFACEKQNNE